MQMSKQVCVIILVVIQGTLLLCFIEFGVWEMLIREPRIQRVWSRFTNGTTEVLGVIDLEDESSNWLMVVATKRNITRALTNTTLSQTEVNETIIYPREKILYPVIKHKQGEIFMLVFVTTIPKAVGKREIIRSTWANIQIRNDNNTRSTFTIPQDVVIYIQFIVGQSGNLKVDTELEREAEKFGDILRGDFEESYRNIVVKVWYAFTWATRYKPKYVFKVDDDMYVNIPRLVSWLKDIPTPRKLYAGYVHHKAYIARNPKNKHYVSFEDFAEKRFPSYCAGPCYIFSGNLLEEFIKWAKELPMFRVEDAFLGLVARKSGVKPRDIGGKLFVLRRSLTLNSLKRWRDGRLPKVICIGDSLTSSLMQYIDDRYRGMSSK